jgi:hypothetical protein
MIPRKKSLGVLALCLLPISVLAISPVDAASSGAKCSKVGVVQKTKGITYTCTRAGKSLKWVRKPARTMTPNVPTTISGAQLLLGKPIIA